MGFRPFFPFKKINFHSDDECPVLSFAPQHSFTLVSALLYIWINYNEVPLCICVSLRLLYSPSTESIRRQPTHRNAPHKNALPKCDTMLTVCIIMIMIIICVITVFTTLHLIYCIDANNEKYKNRQPQPYLASIPSHIFIIVIIILFHISYTILCLFHCIYSSLHIVVYMTVVYNIYHIALSVCLLYVIYMNVHCMLVWRNMISLSIWLGRRQIAESPTDPDRQTLLPSPTQKKSHTNFMQLKNVLLFCHLLFLTFLRLLLLLHSYPSLVARNMDFNNANAWAYKCIHFIYSSKEGAPTKIIVYHEMEPAIMFYMNDGLPPQTCRIFCDIRNHVCHSLVVRSTSAQCLANILIWISMK